MSTEGNLGFVHALQRVKQGSHGNYCFPAEGRSMAELWLGRGGGSCLRLPKQVHINREAKQ